MHFHWNGIEKFVVWIALLWALGSSMLWLAKKYFDKKVRMVALKAQLPWQEGLWRRRVDQKFLHAWLLMASFSVPVAAAMASSRADMGLGIKAFLLVVSHFCGVVGWTEAVRLFLAARGIEKSEEKAMFEQSGFEEAMEMTRGRDQALQEAATLEATVSEEICVKRRRTRL